MKNDTSQWTKGPSGTGGKGTGYKAQGTSGTKGSEQWTRYKGQLEDRIKEIFTSYAARK